MQTAIPLVLVKLLTVWPESTVAGMVDELTDKQIDGWRN